MKANKNLMVEIYGGDGSKSCIVDKNEEVVRSELQRLVSQLDPEPIIQYLLAQREGPATFPNVIIFWIRMEKYP